MKSHESKKHDIDYPWLSYVRDAFSFIGRKKWSYFLAILIALSYEVAWLYFPIGLGQVVNFLADYTTGDSLQPLYQLGLILLLVSLWHVGGQRISRWMGNRIGVFAAGAAFKAGTSKLLHLGGAWHSAENSGNKVKRIQTGSKSVERFFVFTLRNLIAILVSIPGVLIVIWTMDKRLAVFFAVFVIIYAVISRRYIKKGARFSHAVSKEKEKLSGIAFEAINNIRTVQTGALIKPVSIKVHDIVDRVTSTTYQRINAFKIGGVPPHIFANMSRLALLGYAAYAVTIGQYEIGMLVIVMGFFRRIWISTFQFTDLITEFLIMRYDAWRLMEILRADDYVKDAVGSKKFPKRWQRLSVTNVSFKYEDGQKTLHNVCFDLDKGKKIGLVGLSGAGKSTLFKLLTREREPSSGTIAIDGLSIQDIKFHDYFSNIGVVLQETELFSFSLKENIAQVSGRINKKQLDHAIKAAYVDDFLHKLPEGVDTKIGEKGFKLSGGEKQRVGIARAIYHKPEILFFDEATSHLDVQSEKKIQEALHKVLEGTTAVVIAHRLSTLQQMDEILVMNKGKIIEQGSFQELIDKQGKFYKLWQEQKL